MSLPTYLVRIPSSATFPTNPHRDWCIERSVYSKEDTFFLDHRYSHHALDSISNLLLMHVRFPASFLFQSIILQGDIFRFQVGVSSEHRSSSPLDISILFFSVWVRRGWQINFSVGRVFLLKWLKHWCRRPGSNRYDLLVEGFQVRKIVTFVMGLVFIRLYIQWLGVSWEMAISRLWFFC